jgi:putative acetyltransferase
VGASTIREAGEGDWGAVRELFVEYGSSLDFSLCFQGFDDELATLPGRYAAPSGCILLATEGAEFAGVVALRPLESGDCEMKRLYIRPAWRGRGVGMGLARAVIARAQAIGYARMVLDTHESMIPAIALYRRLGFTPTARYNDNPLVGVRFFARDLAPRKNRVAADDQRG